MFLPNFLSPSGSRSSSSRSKPSKRSSQSRSRSRSPDAKAPSASSEYISDESQLRPVPELPQDVSDLNQSLAVLTTLFPDVQVEVFREMLLSFSEESRLAVVADAMLKNPAAYIKGRRRARRARKQAAAHALEAADPAGPVEPAEDGRLPRAEAFRDHDYQLAVRALASQEFKGLSRSAINAVLSEYNYSYLDARPTLVSLSSKSWKFAISSMLFRRRPVTTGEAETHPLVVWKSTGQASIVPTLKSTGNAELDRELYEELIAPLKQREAAARTAGDHTLAQALHTDEAEAAEAMYECTCCFSDATFEEFTTCNADGHMVCFRCVRHSISEAVFGQGWARSIDPGSGTLRCPAVASDECKGCISAEHIHRAMQEETKGAEILHKLDQRLADHELLATGLPLVRCPFCSYAEVDDLYVPATKGSLRMRTSHIPNVILFLVLPFLVPLSVLIAPVLVVAALLYLNGTFRNFASHHYRAAVTRCQRRRIGLRFTCRNPACGRASCMSCSKAWIDVHICHESSLVALRTQVEQAMSMAVKRVCPRCHTSFVKTAGCNKLTCPCGYKMCYVCRKDIGAPAEGYQHFCQHFRPEGDGRRCLECRKCNLWENEDTDAILRQAKQEAERKWRATERRELSGAEKAYLETGFATAADKARGDSAVRRFVAAGRIPSMEDVCDSIVETLFVVAC